MHLIFSRKSSHCSVPLSIVTHTGIYKQRNGTEQERRKKLNRPDLESANGTFDVRRSVFYDLKVHIVSLKN